MANHKAVGGTPPRVVIVTAKNGELVSKGKPIEQKYASAWLEEENSKHGKDGLTSYAVPVAKGKSTVVTLFKTGAEAHGQPIDPKAAAAAVKDSNEHSGGTSTSFCVRW